MTTSHTMPPSRWRRQRRLLVLAAVVPLGLGLVACGDDDEDEASTAQESDGGDNGSGGGGGGGDAPSVEITSPADGDTIGPNFDVEMQSNEEIGEPDTGRFHFHVFVDGDQEDYEIAYEDSAAVDRDLSEGEHTVEVALANPDHSLVEGATDEITVTVGGDGASGAGGAGGSGDGSSTTSGDDGGYDY